MEKGEKFQSFDKLRIDPEQSRMGQTEKIGKFGHINGNCWLAKSLNYAPYKRCQYCELKFRNCLFLHYQIISLILIFFFLTLFFLIEGKISELIIISVFTLVIVYGYFFNKSTDKIIQANFTQREAKEALEELTERLEEKVNEQTKEIRKAYEVEKKARKELQRLDAAKDQFIMATQHHLRTPLTSMMGYLDLILTETFGKVPSKLKAVLKKFEKSTTNEIKIVNELLDIAQFQLGKEVVSLQPNIQIEPILKEIIEELEFETNSKNIYLKIEKPERPLPAIKADPQKLKVALFNIIDNAVKYTARGGVKISLKSENSPRQSKLGTGQAKLKIIVKDTGMGIPKEELPTLFTRIFERPKSAQKTYTTGKGIGLFITSKIIQAHNGKIWAESEGLGKGSAFYVEFPIG